MTGRRIAGILAPFLAVVILIAACSADESSDDGRLRVAATVSPITSLVESIGGDRIHLTGIVPEGFNSHTYEPAPSVAITLSKADLIVANGLFLEEPTIRLAEENAREDSVILRLADRAISPEEWVYDFAFPQSGGHPNPHLWTDPLLAKTFAEIIHETLVDLDPENAAYYDANLAELSARLDDLDMRIATAVETIPPEHRKLLTYHDSFPYFAQRYGFEIIGAIQPADFSEPSAREVADLIILIRETDVPAVFGSVAFPSPVLQAIAQEGGAQLVDSLRDDDLPGAPGDPRHSYLGLMVTDVEIIVSNLGGDITSLQGFDTSPTYAGESTAIYPQ